MKALIWESVLFVDFVLTDGCESSIEPKAVTEIIVMLFFDFVFLSSIEPKAVTEIIETIFFF